MYPSRLYKNQINIQKSGQIINNPIGKIQLNVTDYNFFKLINPNGLIYITFLDRTPLYTTQFSKELFVVIYNFNNPVNEFTFMFDENIVWDYIFNPAIVVNSNTYYVFQFITFNSSLSWLGTFIGQYSISELNNYVLQPNIINFELNNKQLKITSSEFSTSLLPDIHSSTEYEICEDSNHASIVYSLNKLENLTEHIFNFKDINLIPNTKYYLFIRYFGTTITPPSQWTLPFDFIYDS